MACIVIDNCEFDSPIWKSVRVEQPDERKWSSWDLGIVLGPISISQPDQHGEHLVIFTIINTLKGIVEHSSHSTTYDFPDTQDTNNESNETPIDSNNN